MKPFAFLAIVIAFVSSGTAAAGDAVRRLESRSGDISVMYDRKVLNFGEMNKFKSEVAESLDIVVLTSEAPSQTEYEVAMAYAESLKSLFPRARFSTDQGDRYRADYYFFVSEESGGGTAEQSSTVYGSRTSSVNCSNSYGSVTCSETGSILVPVGTKTENVRTRYVDIYISLSRSQLYGTDNPKITSDGRKVAWESVPVSEDFFTVAFAAGECKNDTAAAATVAKAVATEATTDRPDKVRIQVKDKTLNCRAR